LNILERQIREGESQTVEFVSSPEPFDKVLRNVVAFLNTNGGVILIGVEDDCQIIGVQHAKKIAVDLYTQLQESISPKALFSVAAEQIAGKEVIVVEVPGGKDTPFVTDGAVYLRKGSHTTKATGEDLQRLLQDRAVEVERWERRGSPVLSVTDFDIEEIQRMVREAIQASRFEFRNAEDVEAVLLDLGMRTRGMFTNAADVCFGKRPSLRNPQVRVRAFAFESDKAGNYVDQADSSGPVVQMIEQTHKFIVRNSPLTAQFLPQTLKRADTPAYPAEAIREGLVNALAHRDYAAFSSGATVTLYPDRVEIWNSGHLPKGWKEEKLRRTHPSLPSNPDIAHVLFIRGFMERIGRGTLKIIEACRTAGIPAPKWSVDSDGITLALYNRASKEAPQERLNDRQKRLIQTLQPGQTISASEYTTRFAEDVVERQARRDLRELEDADLMWREGKGKATLYVRTERRVAP
jgi:ATP-dependent DNA helicase RecG